MPRAAHALFSDQVCGNSLAIEAVLLEDRILFSAAPLEGMAVEGEPASNDFGEVVLSSATANGIDHVVTRTMEEDDVAADDDTPALGELSTTGPWAHQDRATSKPPVSPSNTPLELAFIDSAAGDAELFLRDLEEQAGGGRRIEIVVLDSTKDGIGQISEVLTARSTWGAQPIDAVHIISHGNERGIRLGTGWLSVTDYSSRLGEIAQWNDALAEGGDLLFYGCDLASTAAGRSMLESIAAACKCDIAASVDDTGASIAGGNWVLEYTSGTIDVDSAVSLGAQHEFSGLLATFTVTNTNNSGAGSLRQAIIDANAAGGADIIDFNIPLNDAGHFYYQNDGVPGTLSVIAVTTLNDAAIADFDPDYPSAPFSWYSIQLSSALPSLSDTVVLDATTQPGFTSNPVIELDGSAVGGSGLVVTGGGSTIRGFVINQFGSRGILLNGSGSNTIVGNYIGTDVTATADLGNSDDGIEIQSNNNTIGGLTVADRNIISGNGDNGVFIDGASGNQILGNFIGTNFFGTSGIGNSDDGVHFHGGATNNTVGGIASGAGNTIAFNSDRGVMLHGGDTRISIRGNSIFSNGSLGIDLAQDGVTANDLGDGDSGENNFQNFPVLTSAVTNGVTTTVGGTLNSTANTAFDLDFYSNAAGDGSGNGEGQVYLGSGAVLTNGSGNASFSIALSSAVSAGAVISGTATDPLGNTSEFAANFTATAAPEATDDPQDFQALTSSLSPVGYWRLGETSGSTAADSVGGNDGTYNGPTLGQAGALAGDSDTSVQFVSADSDYLEIPHSAAYLLATGSVQLWFNTATPAQDGALFSKDHSGLGSGGHLTIWLDGGGLLQVRLQSDTGDNSVATSSAVTANQWHHVVFTFGSGGMQLFLDGQLVDTDVYAGGLGSTSGGAGNFEPIAIGAGTRISTAGSVTPLNQFYDGRIDEVAIFDAALTAEQVQNLYAAGLHDYTVSEGATLNVGAASGVLANDFHPLASPLTAILVGGPSNAASFSLNPDGSYSYEHDGSETTTDSFTYQADDGSSTSNTATATISITAVNDAPVLDNTGAMTLTDVNEDDTNPPGDTVSAIVASAGGDRITDADAGAVEGIAVIGVDDTNGQWQYDAGSGWTAFGAVANNSAVLLAPTASIRFVPTASYNGSAGNITFRAWDQTDGNASGDIGIDVSTNGGSTAYSTATETATLTVNAVNDAPVNSLPAPQSTNENTSLVFSVGNGNAIAISDADAGAAPVQVTLSVSNGTLTLAQTTGLSFSTGDGAADASMTFTGAINDINAALDGLAYQPASNYSGPDSLAITTDDLGNSGGGPQSDSDVVAITVNLVGVPPVARDDSAQVAGPSLMVSAPGVLGNDTDLDSQPLTAVLVSAPQNGSVILNADGSFTYTPAAGFFGIDTFRYVADDGILTSAPATVSILVLPGVGLPPTNDGDTGGSSDGDELSSGAPDDELFVIPIVKKPASSDSDNASGNGKTSNRLVPEDSLAATLDEDGATDAALDILADQGTEAALYARFRSTSKSNLPSGTGVPAGDAFDGRGPRTFSLDELSQTLQFDAGLLFDRLDQLEKQVEERGHVYELVVGTATATTTVLTTGYVVWLVRGGYLFAGILSSMPAWYRFDPLPVLECGRKLLPPLVRKRPEPKAQAKAASLDEIAEEDPA